MSEKARVMMEKLKQNSADAKMDEDYVSVTGRGLMSGS